MKPLRTAVLVLAIAATATGASAQGNPSPGTGPMGSMPMHHPMGGMMGHQPCQQAATPTEPGQAAFGAIQEIVGKLQADPQTDWSKVDVDGCVRDRASRLVLAGHHGYDPSVVRGERDAVPGMWVNSRQGTTGAHRAGLPPVSLPVWEAVQ